jgi:hypothetical protein
MHNVWQLFLCLVVSVVALINVQPLYAQPAAFVERSGIVGVKDKIYITRVPTRDSKGRIQYFDITIDLNVTDAGIANTATVVSKRSPRLLTNEFVAGDYEEAGGAQCEVAIGVALQGRTTGVLNCTGGHRQETNAAWYTGPIAGHPFQPDLIAAGIDKIPGNENVSWGKHLSGYSAFDCFFAGQIIGVNQAGNVVAITNYGDDSSVDCGHNFTQVEP